MKKTVFLVVLAVLAIMFVNTLAEAKTSAKKALDGSFLITDVPDNALTEFAVPQLPPEIGYFTIEEVKQIYEMSKIGKYYNHINEITTLVAILPPTFKETTSLYKISLIKDPHNIDLMKWDIKPGPVSENPPAIGWIATFMLLLSLIGILLVGIYDRRFGKRDVIYLTLFYLFSLMPSTLMLYFSPMQINYALDFLLLCVVISLIGMAMSSILMKNFPLAVVNAIINVAVCIMFFLPNQQIASPWRFFSLFIATAALSFFIGEGWYRWHKNRRVNTNIILQSN